MKRKMKRTLTGLLVLLLAVAVGFLSGYAASPGTLHKNRQALGANGSAASNLHGAAKAGETAKKSSEPASNEPVAYTPEHPALMALTLNDTTKEVKSRYGQPYSQYVLEDDSDPVTVYDYSQFSVGFDNNGRVRFVEISGNAADPGLGGVRIGESGAKALKVLGSPDTNTGYVLTYSTDDTVLKLDIVPDSDTIESIKLFTRQDL